MYSIPERDIPAGMSYQFCTQSVMGSEILGNLKEMEAAGWRKVPRRRHSGIQSDDLTYIVQGGQVLMERPKYLTDRELQFDKARADAALLSAMGVFHDAGQYLTIKGKDEEAPKSVGAFVNMPSSGMGPASTQRIPDPAAPAIVARWRRENVLEFCIFHGWRGYTWLREKIARRS